MATLFFFAGCALGPAYRASPDLEEKAKTVKSLLLLPPRVEVYQLDAGGTKEKIDEWSDQATGNIVAAVEREFGERVGLLVKSIDEDTMPEELRSNMEETEALFDAVQTSIILHAYGPSTSVFEDKVKNFDYSLGDEVQALALAGEDALLLINAADHIWTEGRKALLTFGVLSAIGAHLGLGGGGIPILAGGTEASAAIVDSRSGSILWFSRFAARKGYDLRDAESAAELVRDLFKDFQITKEK